MSRSVMAEVKIDAGQLYVPRNAAWVKDCLEELQDFPNGSHDDIVDTISMICLEANTLYRRLAAPQQIETEEERKQRQEEEFRIHRARALLEGLL